MQCCHEDGVFDGEGGLAALEQIVQHLADPGTLPEAGRRAGADPVSSNSANIDIGEDHQEFGVRRY